MGDDDWGLAWGKTRPDNYKQWEGRPTPTWFKNAKLGIMIHWGAYSVPAWAEMSGEAGNTDEAEHFPRNPYAEWYFNTIRFPESGAAKYHKEQFGDCPYDELLDQWTAKDFDADKLVKLFKKAGAKFVVPVTKHHDGITLWDAPGTGTRNTVHRGPRRDIVAEWAKATKDNDMNFGVYYSTGIDWHVWPTPVPWQKGKYDRPGVNDHAYNEYAWKHCADLIDRHAPHVFWADIDWPKAGVAPGEYSVEKLLTKLYARNPEAVVNDRLGDTHWDFKVVEYGFGKKPDPPQIWQSNRGIGFSFGYNQLESQDQYLDGPAVIRLLVDTVSSGGNLLLNVGPDEAGNIPPLQMEALEYMADYMALNSAAIDGTEVLDESIAKASGCDKGNTDEWVRWTRKDNKAYAFVDGRNEVSMDIDASKLDINSGKLLSGESVSVQDGKVRMDGLASTLRPICIEFKLL